MVRGVVVLNALAYTNISKLEEEEKRSGTDIVKGIESRN
jgi:hypothetical protein